MKARHYDILRACIEEYIKSGEAVGSRLLFERGFSDISPALIRAELHELMEEGYLAQPHTSGGRIPTDKGLRFFVDAIMRDAEKAMEAEMKKFNEAASRILDESLERAASSLSRYADALGVGYEFEPPQVYKRGLNVLMSHMPMEKQADVVKIVDDFERLDGKLNILHGMVEADGTPQVFIGTESPLTSSDQLSLVVGAYALGDGREAVLMVVGPKRMDYRKNVALMSAVQKRAGVKKNRKTRKS